MQSRRHSALEAVLNVGSGMIIAFTVTQIMSWMSHFVPGLNIHLSVGSNLLLTVILTVVSVSRGYLWRRYFNNLAVKSMKAKRKSFVARHGPNIKKGKMSRAYWANEVKW